MPDPQTPAPQSPEEFIAALAPARTPVQAIPFYDDPSPFSTALEASVTDSFRQWASVARWGAFGKIRPIDDEEEWRKIVGGQRAKHMKFSLGVSRTEWQLEASRYDSDRITDRLMQGGEWSAGFASFMGDMVGQVVSPSNVAGIVTGGVAGGIINRLGAKAAFGEAFTLSNAVLATMKASNGRFGGAFRGAAGSAAMIPLDAQLTETTGQRQYTWQDAAATVAAGVVLGQAIDMLAHTWRSFRKAKPQEAEALLDMNGKPQPQHHWTGAQRALFNEAMKRGADVSPDEFTKNWDKIEELAWKGELSPENLVESKRPQAGVPEARLDTDVLRDLYGQGRPAANLDPDFRFDVEVPLHRGVKVDFGTDIERALFAIGRGDERMMTRLKTMLVDKAVVGNVDKKMEADIREAAAKMVKATDNALNEHGVFEFDPISDVEHRMGNAIAEISPKVMDAAGLSPGKVGASVNRTVGDTGKVAVQFQDNVLRAIWLSASKDGSLAVRAKTILQKSAPFPDAALAAAARRMWNVARGRANAAQAKPESIEISQADAKLDWGGAQRPATGQSVDLRSLDGVGLLTKAIGNSYRSVPVVTPQAAAVSPNHLAPSKGVEASPAANIEAMQGVYAAIEKNTDLTPETKELVKKEMREVGDAFDAFARCIHG